MGVGDIMPTVNAESLGATEHEVTYSETKLQPCVEIITESGATLKCSTSAPILTREGEPCDAGRLLGRSVPVKNGDRYSDTLVTEVRDIGKRLVQHITCGNQYFLAGSGNGLYLLHHNMKYSGLGTDLYALSDEIAATAGQGTNNSFNTGPTAGSAYGGNRVPSYAQTHQDSAPLGQGLIDAYGEAPAPMGQQDPQSWMSKPFIGTGQSSLPAYDNSWYSPTPPAQGQPVGSPAKGQYDGVGGFIRKTANTIDNKVLGNIYDENTGHLNTGNIAALAARVLVPGAGIAEAVFNKYSQGQVMNGNHGIGTDHARTQMQQHYDRSTPVQQQGYVSDLARKYNMQPEQVLQIIGRGQ